MGVWVLSVVLFIGGALMPDSTPEQTEQSAALGSQSVPPPTPEAVAAPATDERVHPESEPAEPTMAEVWARTADVSLDMRMERFFSQMPDDLASAQWTEERVHTMTWADGSVVVTHWKPSSVPGRRSPARFHRACWVTVNDTRAVMLQTTPTDPAALARRPDTAGPLAVATPTTRRLADASISLNTRRAYLGALRRLDAWRGAAPVDDASLAVYLGELFEAGRAPATAALAVAAVRFRAKLAGQPDPAGEATARVLAGYRRTAADRGRGQAAPLSADGLAAILATAARPRTDGRGVESHTTAQRRGRLDAVIASLLFMGGLRRSEVSALEWRDVSDARDGDGVLITVRTSKTNQEGDSISKTAPRKRSAPFAPPTPHPRIG